MKEMIYLDNAATTKTRQEVVDAMLKVGRSLPYELRETALGGMAACPSCAKFCR